MPWRHTSPMDQKTPFIADYLRDRLSVTERCALYGISRKPAYQWIDRYLRHARKASKSNRVGPARRPATRLTTWWRRSSTHGAGIRPGVRRSWWRSSVHAIPAGPGQPARRSVTSSAATIWCPRGASAAPSGIRANPPAT
jgi:hypothetical protein